MSIPSNSKIIDGMIGFPDGASGLYASVNKQVKDGATSGKDFPAGYLFKNKQPDTEENSDPIASTLHEMDRFNIVRGVISIDSETGKEAMRSHPGRFIPSCSVDPNDVMGEIRKIRQLHREYALKAVYSYPHACVPPVPINDAKYYPIYALCCELDIPIFITAGVPGPRLPMASQRVELIDQVMYDFPDLTFVTRHGCEPWEELAIKLMLKWPGLYYSTSAFSPKYYPKAIVDYANTRGADKIIYAGYYPFGLSLQRIMTELENVPFRDAVWPKFLHDNAAKVFGFSDPAS